MACHDDGASMIRLSSTDPCSCLTLIRVSKTDRLSLPPGAVQELSQVQTTFAVRPFDSTLGALPIQCMVKAGYFVNDESCSTNSDRPVCDGP